MDQNIEDIIRELCRLEPGLSVHKDKLRAVIARVVAMRPDTKFDPKFAERLRAELAHNIEKASASTKTLNPFYIMKKLNFAIGLAVLTIAIAAGVYFSSTTNRPLNMAFKESTFNSQAEITKIAANAFGKLSANLTDIVRPQSGGGGQEAGFDTALSSAAPVGTGGGMGIMPSYFDYTFVYKGEPFQMTETSVSVLRRELGESASGDIRPYLLSNSFNLLDLNRFQNAKLQSFNFTEDRQHGYNVTVNFTDGSIGLSEDFNRWPDAHVICETESCYEFSRIRPGDIPDESEVIAIANRFLGDYGIAAENFGIPYIDNNWRLYYEQSADKASYYLPEVIPVVYPLVVNGQQVFDEGGNPTGMTLSVSVRVKAVSGLWGLTTQRYQASDYEAETDEQRIIKLAESGGFRRYYPLDESGSRVEIGLGTPERGLVKVYNWINNQNQELLVPALIFPVLATPDAQNYYPKQVIVPLARELLDENSYPTPIPLTITPEGR